MSETITKKELQLLCQEFPRDRLRVKVRAFNKDRTRAMLVPYIEHMAVQARLDEVDPAWSCEGVEQKEIEETVYVRLRLTIKGVTRENVGQGEHPKSAYSDALKRCAMLFGIGRYLYDSEKKWVSYNEHQDKYREWRSDDYFGSDGTPAEKPATTTNGKQKLSVARAPAPDLGDYVVRFGKKFMGYKLSEIGQGDLISYVRYLNESGNGEPSSSGAREFVEKASEFLATRDE